MARACGGCYTVEEGVVEYPDTTDECYYSSNTSQSSFRCWAAATCTASESVIVLASSARMLSSSPPPSKCPYLRPCCINCRWMFAHCSRGSAMFAVCCFSYAAGEYLEVS